MCGREEEQKKIKLRENAKIPAMLARGRKINLNMAMLSYEDNNDKISKLITGLVIMDS